MGAGWETLGIRIGARAETSGDGVGRLLRLVVVVASVAGKTSRAVLEINGKGLVELCFRDILT